MVNRHEPRENFQSERRFEIWDYTVSHSQLLLRSAKTNSEQTRTEVLFKGVKLMNLMTPLEGLSIEKCSENSSQLSKLGYPIPIGCDLYRVLTTTFEGYAFEGYVMAAAMFVHVDDLDFNEPSQLFFRMLQ
jgi:hypothetical protein